MKIGDYLCCTRSSYPDHYTVGNLYEIVGFDKDGDPIMATDSGDIDHPGCPLNGFLWDFEPVDAETDALIKLLEISEADVAAGRVMTRQQLLDTLNKEKV